MKSIQMPYRSRLEKWEGKKSSIAARIASASGAIAVLGAVVAGAWTLFTFLYQHHIAPRLHPAIIHTSSEWVYKASTDCCNLYQIQIDLVNKGDRVVTVHASQFAAWAWEIAPIASVDQSKVVDRVLTFNRSRPLDYSLDDLNPFNVVHTATEPREPLLLSVGNIVPTSTHLAPNEPSRMRAVAVVPKSFSVGSLRGILMASHFEESEIDWRWSIDKRRLIPLPMTWLKAEANKLRDLSRCIRDQASKSSTCAAEVAARSSEVYLNHWEKDGHSYMLHVDGDFVLTPSTTVAK